MYLDEYTMRLAATQTHNQYVAESNIYRTILQAERSASTKTGRVAVPRNALERLGAALISLGRRLCERRGSMHVEVQFRTGASPPRTNGRHVA